MKCVSKPDAEAVLLDVVPGARLPHDNAIMRGLRQEVEATISREIAQPEGDRHQQGRYSDPGSFPHKLFKRPGIPSRTDQHSQDHQYSYGSHSSDFGQA